MAQGVKLPLGAPVGSTLPQVPSYAFSSLTSGHSVAGEAVPVRELAVVATLDPVAPRAWTATPGV